jgi:hypothetical protein
VDISAASRPGVAALALVSPPAASLVKGAVPRRAEATDRMILDAAGSGTGAAQKLQDFDALSVGQQEAVSAAMNFSTTADFRARLQIQAAFDRSSLATPSYAPGSIMSTKV